MRYCAILWEYFAILCDFLIFYRKIKTWERTFISTDPGHQKSIIKINYSYFLFLFFSNKSQNYSYFLFYKKNPFHLNPPSKSLYFIDTQPLPWQTQFTEPSHLFNKKKPFPPQSPFKISLFHRHSTPPLTNSIYWTKSFV